MISMWGEAEFIIKDVRSIQLKNIFLFTHKICNLKKILFSIAFQNFVFNYASESF